MQRLQAMALELGLKVTRTRASDNATFVSELRISKNTAGPVFVSTETHSSFILTCYLKGYDRNSFQIKISEDGKEISISGEKPVQEMMIGRVMLKKNVQIVGFRKVFEIPNGVVLDRIKAKFDEDESLLKIVMPKLVKGIRGVQIEEVKKEGFGESSQKASATEENECVCRKEEGPRFEAMKESEFGEENADHIPENIGGERPEEVSEIPVLQPLEESDNIMLGRPPGTTREDEVEEIPKEENGEFKFGNGGRDEEKVPTEMSKKGIEAIETSKEGEESKKVFDDGTIVISGKDKTIEIEQGEDEEHKSQTEDRGEQSVKDILVGKDAERVGKKITEEGLEALDTEMEGRKFDKVHAGAFGTSEEGIIERTQNKENRETKFGSEGKDEERVRKEISKEGLEAIDTAMERREPEKVLADEAFGINGEDTIQGKQKKEIEQTKFERESKDKERAGTEINKGGLEAIDATMERRESKKVRAEDLRREPEKVLAQASGINGDDIIQGKQKKEIEQTKFERESKDEERVGTKINKAGLEAIDSTMERRESENELAGAIEVDENKQREVDEKAELKTEETKLECEGKERVGEKVRNEGLQALDTAMEETKFDEVLAGGYGTSREGILEGTQEKENEVTKFGSEGKDEERVRNEISEGGVEAIDTAMERRESEKELVEASEVDEEGKIDENKQREIEKDELKTESKDEERRGRETTQQDLDARETRMGEVEPKKVHGEKIEKEGAVNGIKQKEIEDKDKERVKDEVGGRQQRDIQKLESETRGRGKESVGTETSKEGLEEIDTTTKLGGESELGVAGSIGVSGEDMDEEAKQGGSEAAKFETKWKDEEKLGTKNNKKGFEATESKIEGQESKKVLVGKIGVSDEDRVERTERRETDETEFEIEDRGDKEKVKEVLKGTQEKEIEKNEFAIEGRDEERVGTKIKEEFDAEDAKIEVRVSEKVFSGGAGVSEKDIVEGTKKGEIGLPKNGSRDEEVLKEEISREDFGASKTKIKESPTQEPRLSIQLEESEGTFEGTERGEDKSGGKKLKEIEAPKLEAECATSEGQNLKEIGEATETMAKRQSQEAEGVLEKVEGEEPKMSKEASKVDGKDYARDSEKRKIEESAFKSSGDGHVQENIVSKVFGELGTDTSNFPKRVSETNAKREKEVKVKEAIIVKRETEVKVKEVIVNKFDEAKEAFDKATTTGRIQLETGQPSVGRGFDEEALEAAEWDTTKAREEESVETGPFMKDNKRERTERIQKETEDPKVETKHKAQHRLQELPMKIAESMDGREGPKHTKTGKMKEANRKSEETQVVADEESTIEKKIQEEDQEAPEAKDQEALREDMREREIMLPTQQSEVKEIDKVCEECKRSEENLEREKWRTTQSVKDKKPRRENAVKHVAESMQKAPEKEHPGKSEVEKEVKCVEEKVSYPALTKEVETKYEVEEARLKELPPPKVKVQSLDPLESGKGNMKWKSPKTKKLAPEARVGEACEAGKPPQVQSSSSIQQSMVDEEKFEIDFPKSNKSRAPSEEKEIEALQPNILSDKNLEGKEHFKTLTEDRGRYLLDTEKILEVKKVVEEEKLNQKNEEETLSCKRERTEIAECRDEKRKTKRNGSEEINQIKAAAEEVRDVLADNETGKSQEILLPQTAEIQGEEKISDIREVQQEKRREIPFHANDESEAVMSNREAESQKPNAAHPKESSIKFSRDKPKGVFDKLSKGSSKSSRPCVKEDAPVVGNFPEAKESTPSLESTKASETVANELDKPPAEKLVAEEGKINECRDGRHLEFQEPENQESELDFQESARRRSGQEVEETHFSQQEENHEGHAIEEEKASEAENVTQVEISQESEDLEDIKVEASDKKVELCVPLVFAGSVFIASLMIFFFGRKGAQKGN